MAKSPTPAAAPAPAPRDERMNQLQEAIGAGRRALEVAGPIVAAFPAALQFLTTGYEALVLAQAAEIERDAAQAALAEARTSHATAVAVLQGEIDNLAKATAAARDKAKKDVEGAEAYARKRGADLEAQLAEHQASLEAARRQADLQREQLAADLAIAEEAHAALLAGMAAERDAAAAQVKLLLDSRAELLAKFA